MKESMLLFIGSSNFFRTVIQQILPLSKLDCLSTSFKSEMDLIIWTLLLSKLLLWMLLLLLLLLTEVLLLLRRNDNNLLKMWLGAETVLALRCSRTADRLLRVAISGSGLFPDPKIKKKVFLFWLIRKSPPCFGISSAIFLTYFCKFLYEIEYQSGKYRMRLREQQTVRQRDKQTFGQI